MERPTESRVESTEGARPPAEARPAAPRRVAPKKPPARHGVSVSDPVGDMLTRLRNAVGARHETVKIPASRLKAELARILAAEGYILGYSVEKSADIVGEQLVVKLKYQGRKPVLTGIDRVSRPGRRIYAQKTKMPRVMGGLGVAIISTSAGLMTGTDARRRGLGGEILAQVW